MSLSMSRRGGRPQSFSDEQVFQTITELVVAGGMNAVSLPAIAKRVGCSHQAVTNRFATRDNLLRAYGGWYLDNLLRAEARVRSEDRGALQALIDFLAGGATDEMLGVPGLGGPAEPVKLMMEFDREPVLRDFFAPFRRQTAEWMAERIAQAQIEGDIRADSNASDVAEALMYAVSGAVVLYAFAEPEVVRERTRRATALALRPYRTPQSAST